VTASARIPRPVNGTALLAWHDVARQAAGLEFDRPEGQPRTPEHERLVALAALLEFETEEME
jgi:hypothetical protein